MTLLPLLFSCSVGSADLIPGETEFTASDGGSLDLSQPDGSVVLVADAGAPAADAGAPPTPDAGAAPDDCAHRTCPTNARCDGVPAQCTCLPGFVSSNGQCVANDPGIPAQRTEAQVCAAWSAGHVENAGASGFTKSATACDPGQLSRAALDDSLRRLNLHRWLAGLGPTQDAASSDSLAQSCALVSAWNPAGQSAHTPQPTATCYTPAGAAGAGSSNIAWGSGSAADAIDQWMIDSGNGTTFGHRRWLLNPPLAPVGIGFYRGGNNYGTSACIQVFNASGSGPNPGVIAYPPPGFVPQQVAGWEWTVQGAIPSGTVTAAVVRVSDGHAMTVSVEALFGNYGNSSALTIHRQGWSPAVGETYRVSLTGSSGAPITYEVKPVACP